MGRRPSALGRGDTATSGGAGRGVDCEATTGSRPRASLAGPMRWLILISVATLSACGSSSAPQPMVDGGRPLARPARVAVLVLENRSYEQVIGSARAPYINGLARRAALATRYYAVAHPSLPNYLALTGGSLFGVEHNCVVCDVDGRSIVGQLDAAHRTWKAYFEDIDSNVRPGRITAEYNPHYNPFVYYETVRGVPHDRDRVVGFDALRSDLARG